MISAVVDLLWLELENIDWTGHHAEVAALASSFLNYYRTFYFCHIFGFWIYFVAEANVINKCDYSKKNSHACFY